MIYHEIITMIIKKLDKLAQNLREYTTSEKRKAILKEMEKHEH